VRRYCVAKKSIDFLCGAIYVAFGSGASFFWQRGSAFREMTMLKNFEDFQKYGKDHMDTTLKAWGQMSKGVQAIAAETADYSKKSFEEGSAALEKLLGAKSIEKAIEIQTTYAKTAYEGFVAQATKLGELYADIAKESYKPFETFVAKTPVGK
jgi:hypothetical protein